MLKGSLLVTAFLLTSTTLFASEETIVKISTDESSKIYLLKANVDESSQTITQFIKETYENGKRIKRDALDYKKLPSGLSLEERKNRKIIVLKSNNFDNDQGGLVAVDTLFNGIKNERRSYQFELAKTKDSWALIHSKKEIKHIKILTNKSQILGVIGIKNLVME